MITVVEYLVIAAVIGAVLFGIAVFVFGRGEQMAPLSAHTSPSELPASEIRGDHVRGVRFGLALRGYRMSDVDWTLERLADEIDALHSRLAEVTDTSPAASDSATGDPISAGSPASAGIQSVSDAADGTTGDSSQRSLSRW
ncbi:MAG: DivIVA domain-containing protein [Nakamurella sp.]